MANNTSIKKTHDLMKRRLTDYIKSQYFGDTKILLDASDELLQKDGNLYQKPYIESTPAYTKLVDGIKNSNLDNRIKQFFISLIDNNLGVFKVPFEHQVDALCSFEKQKNLFVATGTGSGKTECFMWPIIYKIAKEAIYSPKSWDNRAVRTILIYPMNSLVSDQIARLRSIIGDEKDRFYSLLKANSGITRRPQFGMYTGRTPYSSRLNKSDNLMIAESYKKTYLIDDALSDEEKEQKQKDIEGLKKIHKYPAKDIQSFIKALEENDVSNYDNSKDAELVLRHEMQKYTPDILITNYSMLEYMLIRESEKNIWDDTKKWLEENKNEKLLIVIDEAHMYSGASGGEVAFLIRRLFSKLGINQERIQFIMTSASMPNETDEDMEYIKSFAESLSGCPADSFKYLFGNKEEMKLINPIKVDIEKLASLQLDNSILSDDEVEKNIRTFAKEIYGEDVKEYPQQWLYNNLVRYKPFVNLFNECRGNAVPYDDLLETVFSEKSEITIKAFDNLLLLAPLAKDSANNVLFPARIHLFFRGLNGIYACCNPKCTNKHYGDGISLGALFTKETHQCPYCNSKVYELINDRRCGALFFKGFCNKNDICKKPFYYWGRKGIDDNEELIECPLYILPENYDFDNKPKNTEAAYLDIKSGKVYSSPKNSKEFIKVLMTTNEKEGKLSFSDCPKCEKRFSFIDLSDFKVKGNLPFYNIVKGQFDAQPMTKVPSKYLPNGGRKVLLFSDSRQSAAILARDMTKMSDRDSFRQTIYLAMKRLYGGNVTSDLPLSMLYPAFLQVCAENKLRFFYGRDLAKFEEDKTRLLKIVDRDLKRGRKINYNRLASEFNTPSGMYQADLIELFCSPMVNFHDLGLGYVSPVDDKLYDAIDDIKDNSLSDEDFIKIFVGFVCDTCTDSFSFDNTVKDEIRREVKYIKGNRYGFQKYDRYIHKSVKEKYPNSYQRIYDSIVSNFYRKEDDDAYFLNLESVKIKFINDKQTYVRCKKCGSIHPFDIYGSCSICESKNIEIVNIEDLKQIDYWRNPIISNEMVKSLNTEEHTAQLSFKDQKIDTWAKTEDYEMRFQDINVEKEGTTPIDILSCTTTMEVGIDIGSLTSIGLRNVPPLRENYQQRAGRAGRRGSSLSTITTYAQGGPHDSFYFRNPSRIIKGKPRKPWIDINSDKIVNRHFNLVMVTRFFESINKSFYDCTTSKFKDLLNDFIKFINDVEINSNEASFLFNNKPINEFKRNLVNAIVEFIDNYDFEYERDESIFDELFNTGILPTYSFPLDVVEFNIEDNEGKTKLSPQRGIDMAISEYAPGRTIVVDKKTYKSGGLYTPIRRKDVENFYRPAEPYFEEKNNYYLPIYICNNRLCGWFGKSIPENGLCPFCGEPINKEENIHHMLKPWGFAPINARDMLETEANSDMSYSDDPCYSATPNNDLKSTKYKNIMIANRKNEEIIILNKGQNSNGFDVCCLCGAAQIHDGKTLRDNGIGAPFTLKGNRVSCNHRRVEEGIYLGTSFITDMFFLQIEIDTTKITDDYSVLKSASVTLCEALKLSASRILDIEYNDLKIGTRTRESEGKKYIDIYFYDSLSSGAGYSTQIEARLDEIFEDTKDVLASNDTRDLCNFWNQKVQYLFNNKLALNLLLWAVESKLPDSFTESDIASITAPIVAILENETSNNCNVTNKGLVIDGKLYPIIPGFLNCANDEITDFDINYSLPNVMNMLI